ncbi:AAA family ATPase [Rhizobium oryzihabitans]|uniref:AAA family ATPase n=2 Tax=Pseudomonadota TaxID=1224 RepID=UPI001AEED08B|nr:AAA family ATPase [Rhizobium oryzihabitans]
MRIKRLYTDPPAIDPIVFGEGVNIILGESDATSSKNNGVGKSLCIEFVNFALLKRKSDSRVTRIPKAAFDPATFICIDFVMHGIPYTIRRSVAEAERPRITVADRETTFAKVEDATDFLAARLFGDDRSEIGFREILGPLVRDERSEFKSIVSCFDTKSRIPDNYAPHLMLLGIDVDIYRSIKGIQKELDDIGTEERRIKDSVQLVRQKDLDEARSDLNALEEEVDKIREGIDALENAATYDLIKDEVLEIEHLMGELRVERKSFPGGLPVWLQSLRSNRSVIRHGIRALTQFWW